MGWDFFFAFSGALPFLNVMTHSTELQDNRDPWAQNRGFLREVLGLLAQVVAFPDGQKGPIPTAIP